MRRSGTTREKGGRRLENVFIVDKPDDSTVAVAVGLRVSHTSSPCTRRYRPVYIYITLDLRTPRAGGQTVRTTRAVVTHDRRPCNCVGCGLFRPPRPRGMVVRGRVPTGQLHRGSTTTTTVITNGRRYSAIAPELDTEPAVVNVETCGNGSDVWLGMLWYLARKGTDTADTGCLMPMQPFSRRYSKNHDSGFV